MRIVRDMTESTYIGTNADIIFSSLTLVPNNTFSPFTQAGQTAAVAGEVHLSLNCPYFLLLTCLCNVHN